VHATGRSHSFACDLEPGGSVVEEGEQSVDGAGGSGARRSAGRAIGPAALLLALSVFLSRILGFVRDMVLAAEIGVGPPTDAYFAAFQIPDLLNYLLAGGALAIAFTPFYLRTQAERGQGEADDLFRVVLGTLGAITMVLTVALWIHADRLVALVFDRFDAETLALTVRLTRIVLPAQVFFVTGGVVRAVLMAHGRFRTQAAAPLLYNGGIIVGGLATGDIEGFAWGALAGAILGQWAYPLWDMRKVGGVSLRVAPWDPRFHAYLWRALPLMIGVSLTTVDEWYEKYFGGQVGVGVIASLAFARRLMMAPVAIIGQAVAAAALPALAAMHAEGRGRDLDAALLGTLRATVALAVAAAGAVFVLATPIVTVVYQRGAFGADDVARVAPLLALLALAVPGWVAQQVAVRAFFAREETWRPMLLGSVLAVAVIPLYLVLGDRLGGEGLAIAGVIAISLNAAVTLVWAQLRFGGPSLAALAGTALRAAVIAGVSTAATAWMVAWVAAIPVVGGSPWLALAAGAGLYGALLLIGTRLAGDAAMRASLAGIVTRLGGLGRRLVGTR